MEECMDRYVRRQRKYNKMLIIGSGWWEYGCLL